MRSKPEKQETCTRESYERLVRRVSDVLEEIEQAPPGKVFQLTDLAMPMDDAKAVFTTCLRVGLVEPVFRAIGSETSAWVRDLTCFVGQTPEHIRIAFRRTERAPV